MYYLNARLVSGIDLVIQASGMEKAVQSADIVVTGEGCIDSQTAMGKAPAGIAALAKKYGKPVIAFCGAAGSGAPLCNEKGIDAFFPVLRQVSSAEEAMDSANAASNLADTAEQVFRTIKTFRR
jgi:glycerate kinase